MAPRLQIRKGSLLSAIAGIWHLDGAPYPEVALERVLSAQAIFGPDHLAARSAGPVALGRRLMRILPEDAFDNQPVTFAGGSLHLVADVRLDNRDELCDGLGLPPADAAHLSDAAILAGAFERWGESCLHRLLGAFAFAVWDGRQHTWLLARDPLGKRPLFFTRQAGLFAFASMPQGLHALPGVACEAEEELLLQLMEIIPRADSAERQAQGLFRNMQKVPAAHFVRVRQHSQSTHRYWEPRRDVLQLGSPETYQEALRAELDAAVRRSLRGAGDVGSHLSGGLDSSSVTASAARLQADRGYRVAAFTAVPQQAAEKESYNRFSDEGDHAAATAALYPNVEHVRVDSRGRSPLDVLPRTFDLYAMPMTNLCNAPWMEAIHDAARARELRVVLTGNLGNFTLSHTGMELLPELFSSGRWIALWQTMQQLHQRREMGWRALLFRAGSPHLPRILRTGAQRFAWRHLGTNLEEASLLRPEVWSARAALPRSDSFSHSAAHQAALRSLILNRIDIATMAKGVLAHWRVDERDPTADQRLVEFSLRVPAEQWLRDGLPSALLRNSLQGRLPDCVRFEFRKGLQGTDWHLEMSKDLIRLREEVERLAATPQVARILDIDRMRGLVAGWPDSGWQLPQTSLLYRTALMRALSGGYFLRRSEEMRARTGA